MIRWVLLLLLGLNLAYLGFALHRTPNVDPYADVPVLERLPNAVDLDLSGAVLLRSPPPPAADAPFPESPR